MFERRSPAVFERRSPAVFRCRLLRLPTTKDRLESLRKHEPAATGGDMRDVYDGQTDTCGERLFD